MGYFPIFLELEGRRCVVVGGGVVAQRKVEGLLAVGAIVTVISPAVTADLASLAGEGRIAHVAREYRDGDLAGYALAVVATDQREVNGRVATDGRARGVWVNAADDPSHSDFILPAMLRRGELVVAVGTGGTSPALARAMRDELEAYFGDEYAVLSRVVADVRREMRNRGSAPDAEAWRRALDVEVRRLAADEGAEATKARLRQKLGRGRAPLEDTECA